MKSKVKFKKSKIDRIAGMNDSSKSMKSFDNFNSTAASILIVATMAIAALLVPMSFASGWGLFFGNVTATAFYDKNGTNYFIDPAANNPNHVSAIFNGSVVIHIGKPMIVGTYDTGSSYSVDVYKNYAYVAGDMGIYILDVSNDTPTFVNFVSVNDADCVRISGNYMYSGGDVLNIFDISDPANPVEVGWFDPGNGVSNIYISGNYAYVGDGSNTLYIIDISNPKKPYEVGTYTFQNDISDIYVYGKYAYIADSSGGLRILDISRPTNPIEMGHYNTTDSDSSMIYALGKYAYVADNTDGLDIFDIHNVTNPTLIGQLSTGDDELGIYVSGNYVYLSCVDDGLRIIDVSNPSSPKEIYHMDISNFAYGLKTAGNKLYLTSSELFYVIKISGETTPSLNVGGIKSDKINVIGNERVENNLDVGGKLTSGGGITSYNGITSYSRGGDLINLYNNDTNLFVVTNSGNVGIGTTSPSAKLDVNGTAQIRGSPSKTGLYVSSNGRVGVGTTNPNELLDVSGSVGNVEVTDDGAHLRFTRGGTNYIRASNTGGQFFFTVNGNEDTSAAMVIRSSGNVGIGTTSPSAKLDVNGSANVNGGLTVKGNPVLTSTSDEKVIYVDNNIGDDTNGDGTQAHPYATISRALQDIPDSFTKPITIHIDKSSTPYGSISLSNKIFTATSGSLTIEGEMNVLDNGTISSYQYNAQDPIYGSVGANVMYINDSSKSWTNDEFKYKLLHIYDDSGFNYYAIIDGNTNHAIYFAHMYYGDVTNKKYEVLDWGTTVSSISINNMLGPVTIQYLWINSSSYYSTQFSNDIMGLNIQRCRIDKHYNGGFGIYFIGSNLGVYEDVLYGHETNYDGIFQGYGMPGRVFITGTKIIDFRDGINLGGVISQIFFRDGSRIICSNDNSVCNVGIFLNGPISASDYSPRGYVLLVNTTTGLKAQGGGYFQYDNFVKFSGVDTPRDISFALNGENEFEIPGSLRIRPVSSAPTTTPNGGGVLYVYNGALYYRGSSGTVTKIADS